MATKPIDPDDLAVGTILRLLVREFAALRNPADPDAAFGAFRRRAIARVGRVAIPFATD